MNTITAQGMSEGKLLWIDAVLSVDGDLHLNREAMAKLVAEVRRLNAVVAADRALMRKSSVAIEQYLDAVADLIDDGTRGRAAHSFEKIQSAANDAMNDLWNMAEHGEVI